MTLLQIFFIISGLIISIIALSIARRERFNALHFLVFLAVGVGLCIFGFFPGSLDRIARIAWVARGADALVYGSIVFLFYFVLLLLQKVESQRQDITRLIRSIALDSHHHEKK
jgi:hypothetical protein